MRSREPIFGWLLISGVALAGLNEAMDAIIAHPTVVGAIIAVSVLASTTFVCRSVYRDRIAS